MIKIIGITGTIGAGKGSIVDFLVKEKKFKHFSVREFLIKEIKKRGLEVNRDSMTLVANDLRKTYSPSYIIECLYKKAVEYGDNSIIESIRSVGEVEALRANKNFILIAVDAPIKKRYNRIINRKSETDNVSFEEFLNNEEREMQSDEIWKQNLKECINLADYKLINDGSIADLENEINKIFS